MYFLIFCSLYWSIGTPCEGTFLYSYSDPITELVSDNITSIYNSSNIWIVEFYAHWCGDCIRYKDTWINVGASFKNWNETVRIAAINCAEQDCSTYQINWTPTVKAFVPFSNLSIGKRLKTEKILEDIINFIEFTTREGLSPKYMPNLLPYDDYDPLMEWANVQDTVSKLIFLVEKPNSYWARNLMVHFGISRDIHIRRIIQNEESDNKMQILLGLTSLPAIIIFHKNLNESNIFYMDTESKELPYEQGKEILESLSIGNYPQANVTMITNMPYNYENKEDTVYVADLEMAMEYLLFNEIPLVYSYDKVKLKALMHFLEVCNLYLPLHNGIRNVLRSLNEWILGSNIVFMTNDIFKAKVKILSHEYSAFNYTAKTWKRCLGSSQLYRGYPCSLWTLLHTLTANEMIDTEGTGTLVAPRIIDYITHFFSCKHCKDNFMYKIEKMNNTGSNITTGVLWLWNIHNEANELLKGDKTEDPQNPKMTWPTLENCPECRNKEGWNLTAVTSYINTIYNRRNIVENKNDLNTNSKSALVDEMLKWLTGNETVTFWKTVNAYCRL